MAKNKTTYTDRNVTDFINSSVDGEEKKADSFKLVTLMQSWTGCEAKMWGPSIIGFGNYQYKYASGHEGDAPLISFSPRKAALTLYIFSDTEKSKALLTKLGKYKINKACIYVKKLSDIDINILKELCLDCIRYLNENYQQKSAC